MSSKLLHQVLENSITTKRDGHGMGLSVVKNVVQKHHGSLRVRSSTHPTRHGSVFNVFLPGVIARSIPLLPSTITSKTNSSM
jgi:nitrogen-specific signal transduction histidine kinase